MRVSVVRISRRARHRLGQVQALAALLAAMTCLLSNATAQTASEGNEWQAKFGARLVAEFKSGIQPTDAAELWTVLGPFWQSWRFATRAVTPTDPDIGFCTLIEQHLKLPASACTQDFLRSLLDFSAQNGGTTQFKVGEELRLPLIEVETYKSVRHFDMASERQRDEALALLRNPYYAPNVRGEYAATRAQSKPQPVPETTTRSARTPRTLPKEGIYSIETIGVRWKVPIGGEFTADELNDFETIVRQLSTKSRIVGIERAERNQRQPAQRFTPTPPPALITQCAGADPKKTIAPVSYANLLATDPIHSSQELAAAQKCTADAAAPRVVIIDRAIRPHPDIAHALDKPLPHAPPADGPQCGTEAPSYELDYHGTYLAGLIAARGVYNAYRGINPEAQIRHMSDSGGPVSIRQRLESEANAVWERSNTHSQIALYASAFGTEDPNGTPSIKTMSERFKRLKGKWIDELRDSKTRLNFPPGVADIISENAIRYLFVVAAGQDNSGDKWSSPIALRDVSIMSPQNFGARSNVLVVTACTSCDAAAGEAALWNRAYYSSPGEQIVQLAAPGGDYLPGLLTETAVGGPDSGGTSAAAAIVAGVASRLLGCYPKSFNGSPRHLKERLLITARQNLTTDDTSKAQAGVVDPQLAMIDPEKSWLKPEGLPLEAITIHRWCNATLDMLSRSNGEVFYESLVTKRIRRITKSADKNYTVREMQRTAVSPDTPVLRISTMESPAKPPPFAIVDRAGQPRCHLYLRHVQDLILGLTELRRDTLKEFYGSFAECKRDNPSLKPCLE
jgi:subtilisin family serine protease